MAHSRRSLRLASLDEDAMDMVLRFLTARDILRLARTSKQLEARCSDARLWARLYREDFLASDGEASDHIALDMAARTTGLLGAQPRSETDPLLTPGAAAASATGAGGTPVGSSSRHTGSGPDPRTMYKTKFVERQEREQRARLLHLATVAENRAKLARLRCRPWLSCVQTQVAITLPTVLLFSALSCAVANLDAAFPPGDEPPRPVPVPWWVVVLLTAAGSASIGFAILTEMCVWACSGGGRCRWVACYGQRLVDSETLLCGMLASELCDIERTHWRWGVCQAGCVCLVALATLLAPVALVVAAAVAAGGGPHMMSVAVVPLYILMCVLPMSSCRTSGAPRIKLGTVSVCMGACCCIAAPLAVLVGLAAAKADGISDMSAVFVAMPLWVMNGLILIGALVACIVSVSQELIGDNCRVGQAVANGAACLLATAVFIAVVVVFEALVVLRVDGIYSPSWGLVFIPVFLVAVPVVVTNIVAATATWTFISRRPEMIVFLRNNTPRRLN
ncbi:hypothetical protein FNF31_06010 [Cafeteria roenbergensis]|uniref:F-box domain-containing protein n=1 Tax=Cafeteria roenbergensis TaxID=33653 RepID=A0A5A8CUJ5_CAFRO|nr:hypothetical protein FNF31_06010 [Cafeteria roenbergensis]KAA0164082.1 hypothetical protein FNF28_03995 [Cafeteria roenbergensis]